ncbi:MAG TPA: 50S ribosomal protein L24 [Candidatus Nanoarchaeia archaeon]|nr:50S ribosomal protein L24 [Candidatus Nanoarchaeia archaeon]
MKEFSLHWKSSSNRRKRRKYAANAPLHVRRKLMSAHLAPMLRKKYKRRSFPLRKGDTVKIMRGQFRKKTGKVENIDRKSLRIYTDIAFQMKRDGSKAPYPLDPSNLQIMDIASDDKLRKRALERNIRKVE